MLEKLKCFIFYGNIFMCVHAKKRCLMYLHVCIGRKGGYYNFSLFIHHGVVILEDLLITLADGIASMYLELISVDSSLSNEMNNLGLSLCTLSTRALQRLRNEVWVYLFVILLVCWLPSSSTWYAVVSILSVLNIRFKTKEYRRSFFSVGSRKRCTSKCLCGIHSFR